MWDNCEDDLPVAGNNSQVEFPMSVIVSSLSELAAVGLHLQIARHVTLVVHLEARPRPELQLRSSC